MHRLVLWVAPALVLGLAACGGGSETVPADTATTAPTGGTTTAAPTGEATATPTGNGATAAPTGNDDPTTLPDLPPNTIALSEFRTFANTGEGSILFTADITQAIPDGAKAFWYTYDGGEWQQLQEAYVSGLRELQAQGSFDVTPKNLVVLAVTS